MRSLDVGGTAVAAPGGPHAGWTERLRGVLSYVFVAVVCYAPMLATKPGVVSDDTKTYLYLDPGRLLREATSMWDPSVALGTVTHQNIGYLLPMGPFFWVLSALHLPIWVAQRLWMGSILFAAAAGVLYLCRLVGVDGVGRIVASLAYGLSPYVMQYAGRISVILLPFSGLAWMVAFMILAVRRRGWRYPAMFALVVAMVSGINASSIVYVGVAPLLYLPYAVFVSREATGRAAWSVFLKAGLLTLLTSLWWLAGLSTEGIYGVDILKYTESVEAASSAAAASEVIRGLGYWYFYNGDRVSLWTKASIDFTTRSWLLALSYAVPIGGMAAAALVRWRHRVFFALLVLVGLVLSVGPHPFGSPTPAGALDKAFMTKTTIGNALRSTDRATPLVILGLAVLLGAGVAALVRKAPRAGVAVAALAGVVILAANAPLLGGGTVIKQFSQPAKPPAYVFAAAKYLNSVDTHTRVYAIPGDNFAAYRYGDTVDPIWVGVLDRPFVTHEQFIQGSIPTANLLYAIDNPLQQGTMDWNSLAPIARLMSAGDILVQYDQQYERYNAPRPALVSHELATVPPGLGTPIAFGAPSRNISQLAMFDETYFDLPPGIPALPPVVVYPVSDPRPVVRAESLTDPLVVDGDNAGVVSAADVGLLASNPTILFSGTLATDPALAKLVLPHAAQLVLTDTNRKQPFEWNSLSENTGYTETATELPTAFVADDPAFDMFPGAPSSSLTTSVLSGIGSVTASSYGTSFTLRSEFRPANAIDHDLRTAWETQGTVDQPVTDQWWQVTTRRPVSADSVTLTQPQRQANASWLTNQYVTRVTLTFDGANPVTVNLGPESRGPGGEVVVFPRRRFETLRVKIDATNLSHLFPTPVGSSLVGFSEIGVGNVAATQVIAMPTDMLGRLGAASLADRLSLIMTRDRVQPVPPRSDPEPVLIRQFRLPTARTFSLVGTARLSAVAGDNVIDELVGRTNPLVVSATSSTRMPGNLGATASATLDGNPKTVWMPGLGLDSDLGSWLDYRFRHPITVSHLTISVSSDAEHSRPTSVLVSAGGATRTVALPPIPVTAAPGSLTTVALHFPAVTGPGLRLTFSKIAVRQQPSYETSLATPLPIGIAQVSIPGVPNDRLPARLPAVCRASLLRIDGAPVPIRVSGSTAAALQGDGLQISTCAQSASGVRLGAGTHLLQAADGAVTGLNLDQFAFDSAPGGGPMRLPGDGFLAGPAGAAGVGSAAPKVSVVSQGATRLSLAVSGATKPFLLVLGESVNKGWQASVNGGPSLGSSVLVDGFANGWVVNPAAVGHGGGGGSATGAGSGGGSFGVTMGFAPQREVNDALAASALALLACIGIVLGSLVRSRRRRPSLAAADAEASEDAVGGAPEPVLANPADFSPASPPSGRLAVGVVAAGLVGYAAGGPWAGAAVGAGVLVALVARRGRVALRAASALAMAGSGFAIVIHEHFGRIGPGGGWPSYFGIEATFVWIAVCLLGADVALDIAGTTRRRSRPRSPATAGGEGAAGGEADTGAAAGGEAGTGPQRAVRPARHSARSLRRSTRRPRRS
jgi:hypothetical protein